MRDYTIKYGAKAKKQFEKLDVDIQRQIEQSLRTDSLVYDENGQLMKPFLTFGNFVRVSTGP